MISSQGCLLNPLHVAALLPVSESSGSQAAPTYDVLVVLAGGREIALVFDSEDAASDERERLCRLIDQASTRR